MKAYFRCLVILFVFIPQVILAGQITIGKKKGYKNDFSSDANCVAVYNFESGALTTDSKGTTTLTDNNTVGTDTTNFIQGAASADFELDNSEYFSVTDANLAAGFPMRAADAVPVKTFSICAWVRRETFGNIVSKYTFTSADKRTFHLSVRTYSTGYAFQAQLGYNAGASGETLQHTTLLSVDTWYHVTFTYDNADKSWAIRVRDTAGGTVGSDATGTANLDVDKLNVEDAPFMIGAMTGAAVEQWMDGQLDEVVVFSDILSETESTNISKGIYR